MPKVGPKLLPRVARRLTHLGERLKDARLRRRLPGRIIAERAGITLPTLYALESGRPGTSVGVLLNVLVALGLDKDFDALAANDLLGRSLQDNELPRRARTRAKSSPKSRPRDDKEA